MGFGWAAKGLGVPSMGGMAEVDEEEEVPAEDEAQGLGRAAVLGLALVLVPGLGWLGAEEPEDGGPEKASAVACASGS